MTSCKIIVTGANGQVGNELQFLAKQYPDFEFHFTDIAELDINPLLVLKGGSGVIAVDALIKLNLG